MTTRTTSNRPDQRATSRARSASGLIGAELGFVMPALAGARVRWPYIVFPLIGAGGGAVAGIFPAREERGRDRDRRWRRSSPAWRWPSRRWWSRWPRPRTSRTRRRRRRERRRRRGARSRRLRTGPPALVRARPAARPAGARQPRIVTRARPCAPARRVRAPCGSRCSPGVFVSPRRRFAAAHDCRARAPDDRERALMAPGMRVLVACSGGPDSAAMLVALARLREELGFTLEAASVDHGLRAEAAADVESRARRPRRSGSPSTRCASRWRRERRSRRTRATRATPRCGARRELGAERIAVGPHPRRPGRDRAQARAARCRHRRACAGIEPRRADGVIRPLIDCGRADVAAFASGNAPARPRPQERDRATCACGCGTRSCRCSRARILRRSNISPISPKRRAHFCAALAPQAESLLIAALQPGRKHWAFVLERAPSALRALALRAWLSRATGREPGRSHLDQLARAGAHAVEVWLPEGWVVRAQAGRLFLTRSHAGEQG